MNQAAPALLPPPRPPDPSRGALRLYINSIEKYLGSRLINFQRLGTQDYIISHPWTNSAYNVFVTESPTTGDITQDARNRELYNMFVTAIMDDRNPGPGQLNPLKTRRTHSTCHMSQSDAQLSQRFIMTHSDLI
jgi:hypothetical protein